MGTQYVSFFGKLVKDSPEANVAIMMTLLKISTMYFKDNKKLYLPKWSEFFVETFPGCTFTFKQKEGKKVPAMNDAVKYLCEKGFGSMIEVSGKDYKLFVLNKDSIDKINNALDKDSLNDDQDAALYKSIEDYYATCEKSASSAAGKISFDSMFN